MCRDFEVFSPSLRKDFTAVNIGLSFETDLLYKSPSASSRFDERVFGGPCTGPAFENVSDEEGDGACICTSDGVESETPKFDSH